MSHTPDITSIDNLKYMWEVCSHHWQSTWADYQNLFEGKTCVDIGIWKGLLNAKAEKQLNCKTKIGVEPSFTHRADCKKINPHTKLYPSIDDLPDGIFTDIILLHGVIWLMDNWTQEIKTLLSKVNCKHVHIRSPNHDTYPTKTEKMITDDYRNFTKKKMKYYNGPTINDIVEFFSTENYSVIDRKETNANSTIVVFEKKI